MAKRLIPPAPEKSPAPEGPPALPAFPEISGRRARIPPLPPAPRREVPPREPELLPERPPGVAQPRRRGPPLFIKIEKYQDVVNTLHKLKAFALSLRDALDALADVERELRNGIELSHKALDRFNQTIATLDTKISRLPPEEELDAGEREDLGEMEAYVRNLHEQVQKIRGDLRSASVEQ